MCRKEGKILAEIYSQQEQMELDQFARKFSNNQNIWIGLTYRKPTMIKNLVEGFKWESSGALPIFLNWDKGYPNNNKEWKCVALFNGKWRNIDCDRSGYGVCQEGIRGCIYK